MLLVYLSESERGRSSPPRSISFYCVPVFHPEFESTVSAALFLQELVGTYELKIQEGNRSTSLRFFSNSRRSVPICRGKSVLLQI